ncbi:MAG: SDR family NAD(P)-dependent oxidoreductase [Syntrophobacteraceae bacterium]|nr:SDR family NAD(P)-dependent oxidoreductase [Syntrophobacteraceae bacterium]
MSERVWLITGVNSGFGKHITQQLLQRGEHVVGTVRKPESVVDLVDQYPEIFRLEVLDIRDTGKIREMVNRTMTHSGRIDVLVSNAGYGLFGAAEELSDGDHRHEPHRLDSAHQSGAAPHARRRSRPDHPIVQLRRPGRFPRQLLIPCHQMAH